jgi:uncharacterized protein DUF5670
MFVVLAVILAIAWIGGFAFLHVSAAAIHVLLFLAVLSVLVHVLRNRRVASHG